MFDESWDGKSREKAGEVRVGALSGGHRELGLKIRRAEEESNGKGEAEEEGS